MMKTFKLWILGGFLVAFLASSVKGQGQCDPLACIEIFYPTETLYSMSKAVLRGSIKLKLGRVPSETGYNDLFLVKVQDVYKGCATNFDYVVLSAPCLVGLTPGTSYVFFGAKNPRTKPLEQFNIGSCFGYRTWDLVKSEGAASFLRSKGRLIQC
mmetsp:Transcript_6968/g.14436  ORF Transcript_6968/g.14436 Transcript_6968/m.14436 type:complete len:155 (-) Transcript_6968:326-790(-)